MPKGKPTRQRPCRFCESQFLPNGPVARYCTPVCNLFDHMDCNPGHGPKGDCWLWTGATLAAGYGIFGWAGKYLRAHRISYEWFNEPVGPRLFVCHDCDNPPCVNPRHLFLGTHDANMGDMVAKHRARHGERHPEAKLTAEDVRAIRAEPWMPQVELAKKYGIGQSEISRILRRETWKHLD